MFTGETVVVRFPTSVQDDMNNTVYAYGGNDQMVDNVLIAPGSRADVIESNRPEGVLVRYTLYFPKGFEADVQNCRITIRGHDFEVIGKPDFYTKEIIPTPWWLQVEVVDVDG